VPQHPYAVPTEAPLTPPKKRHIIRNVVFGVIGLFVLLIVMASLGSTAPNTPAGATVSLEAPAPAAREAAAPAPAAATFTAGTYSVGSEFPAGTYRTTGPSDGIGCGWSRLKGTSGELSDIIANDLVQGPSVFTVKGTDDAVELVGDCTWTKTK
jgi:hypothetical protein